MGISLRKNTGVVERVPINVVIKNLTENYLSGNRPVHKKQSISIDKSNLTDKLKHILGSQNFPFDIFTSQVYLANDKTATFLMGGYLGDLLVGNDWVFFGRNWYTEGKAINTEYAYRQGDVVSIGYTNEFCEVDTDRHVKLNSVGAVLPLELSEKYNPKKLFSDVGVFFNSVVIREVDSGVLIGRRSSVYFGRVLASGKLL